MTHINDITIWELSTYFLCLSHWGPRPIKIEGVSNDWVWFDTKFGNIIKIVKDKLINLIVIILLY
jgi:hypothetical protein